MLETLWNILQVALGIGLVIFVHEAGHFLAARWCKVRVEVFSLGFGPKLFGWTRGDTLYQVAAVPLGGYVKMAGEDMFDPNAERRQDDLGAKSIPQRFLIFSGGVIMNMIFALVVFPLILMAGVPFGQPMIRPIPGEAAWQAGLPAGTIVEEINGSPVYAFLHIGTGVALADDGDIDLLVREPGSDKSHTVQVTPVKSETEGFYTIGVTQALDPDYRVRVAPESPAEAAGLEPGFRLVSVETPYPDYPIEDQIALVMLDCDPIVATFLDDTDTEHRVTINPSTRPGELPAILGVRPPHHLIRAARDSEATRALGLEQGKLLMSLNGTPILNLGDLKRMLPDLEGPLAFTIRDPKSQSTQTITLDDLTRAERIQLARDVALHKNSEDSYIMVQPNSAADRAGIRSNDRVLSIDDTETSSFNDILEIISSARKKEAPVKVVVERDRGQGDKEQLEFVVTPEPYESPEYYGFDIGPAMYTYKASDPIEAAKVGFVSSWRFIEDAFVTLKGMLLTNRVESKNLGGIITIAVVANSSAKGGLTKLLFFLCLLSVNLAFLNVLPIPVLDGGQMFFLLLEAIKGSPVSEKVMSYSQLVGLIIIFSLMIYVIKNDIVRWIL